MTTGIPQFYPKWTTSIPSLFISRPYKSQWSPLYSVSCQHSRRLVAWCLNLPWPLLHRWFRRPRIPLLLIDPQQQQQHQRPSFSLVVPRMMEVPAITSAWIVTTFLPKDPKLGRNFQTTGRVRNVVLSSVASRKSPRVVQRREQPRRNQKRKRECLDSKQRRGWFIQQNSIASWFLEEHFGRDTPGQAGWSWLWVGIARLSVKSIWNFLGPFTDYFATKQLSKL